jgi:regulatory protein
MGLNSPSLKGRALRYLSQREHSRSELVRKLTPYVQEGDDLDAVLTDLEAKGFISAQRVAQSVLNQQSAKLGTVRIKQTLYAKGVDADTIAQALETLADTETERALALWRRKFGSVATDPKERLRQMQFLARRGFSTDAVRQASKASPE